MIINHLRFYLVHIEMIADWICLCTFALLNYEL